MYNNKMTNTLMITSAEAIALVEGVSFSVFSSSVVSEEEALTLLIKTIVVSTNKRMLIESGKKFAPTSVALPLAAGILAAAYHK